MSKPLIFDIKRYSINDGPGVRVTLFFKGCPLSCKWCHNPESQKFENEKLFFKNKCIGCFTCIDNCPQNALTSHPQQGIFTDMSKCTLCGKCAEVCPTTAMQLAGRMFDIEEVKTVLEKEIDLMKSSGGGITFSGGEPLMFADELIEVAKFCKKLGIHCAIDTSGFVRSEIIEKVIPFTDLFLYDLKLMDSSKHKEFTGAGNELILKNLQYIAASEVPYQIRIPLIEGVNTDDENIGQSIAFILGLPKKPELIGLLPYHDIATVKYERLGKEFDDSGLTESGGEKLQRIIELFNDAGLKVRIGG